MLKQKFVLKTLSVGLLGISLSSMWSCGGGGNSEITTTTTDSSFAVDSSEAVETMEMQSYMLPSPLQIAYIFKKSGLKYETGIVNAANNASKYSSVFSQSLNLGVYSSDMAYCVLNKQNQEAISYLKTVKNLSDKLGMSSAFDSDGLIQRFEKNIAIEDSIMFILAEIQRKSDEALASGNKLETSAIIFSGAWLESMYIGSKIAMKTKNKNFSGQIVDQMGILDNLLKALKSQEAKDSNIAGLLTDLNSVKNIYNSFESVKNLSPDSEAAADLKITDAEMSSISKKIEELRTKIING